MTSRAFWSQSHNISRINFWPAQVVHDELQFGQAFFYEHHEPLDLLAVGASGTYVLVAQVVALNQGGGYLGLLHFSATPHPHATFHKLDVGDLAINSGSHFALDEALGLVLIVDKKGIMTAISYV